MESKSTVISSIRLVARIFKIFFRCIHREPLLTFVLTPFLYILSILYTLTLFSFSKMGKNLINLPGSLVIKCHYIISHSFVLV